MRVLLLLLLALLVAVHAKFVEETFERLKDSMTDKIVVFYRSKSGESRGVLDIMEKAAKKISKKVPNLDFFKCDGDMSVNAQLFQHAQFNTGTWIFTTTQEHGIERYMHEVEVDTIVRHVLSKFERPEQNDVLLYEDEDAFYDRMDLASKPLPIFVKFFEQSCSHCQKFKSTFQRVATYFKGVVEFMEVECSKNEETTAFCSKSNVRAYPTLILFTGEEKVTFEEGDRSLISIEKFFHKHVPSLASPSSSPSPSPSPSPAPAPAPKQEEKKPKAESKKAEQKVEKESPLASAKPADPAVDAKIASLENKVDQLSSLLMQLLEKKKADKDEL